MKIAVVGLCAVGGLMAVRLARAGHEVSALARGATLAAVREHGIRLLADNQELRARVVASDDAATLGPQDLVVVALKGPALVDAAASLQPLLGAQTVVMPAMNGVPWWFLQPGSVAADAGLTDQSLPKIGSHFGGKDHTTVMYAVKKVEDQIAQRRNEFITLDAGQLIPFR